jgi:SET domain-containing protein
LTYVLNLDADTAIDGAEQGNDARFINHSCEFIFDCHLQSATSWRISPVLGREHFPCHCGTPTYRGSLVAFPARHEDRARNSVTRTSPPQG